MINNNVACSSYIEQEYEDNSVILQLPPLSVLRKPRVKKLISKVYGVSIEEINKVINREENNVQTRKN